MYGFADLVAYTLTIAEKLGIEEPFTFHEDTICFKTKKWLIAMNEEVKLFIKAKFEILRNCLREKELLGASRSSKERENSKVEDKRSKAHLVAKGFSQKEEFNFSKVFSPVVKHISILVLLTSVTFYNLELEQLNVNITFLHSELEETIYMSQLEGFVIKGKEDHFCRLKHSLCSLKQSPRQWYKRFDGFMLSHGYLQSAHDNCTSYKRLHDNSFIYLLLYVDDMLIVVKNILDI